MNINGLQKLTLLDYPGHVAATVFLAGCNMRCPWCHNSELIDGTAEAVMDEKGLLKFLDGRKGILDGVCFTGGEPLLRPELPELMKKIKDLGYLIKLDTNGYLPDRLEKMLDDRLIDYVAMDIKNSPERYAETAGLPEIDMEKIRLSISHILGHDTDYEFRTTVMEPLHDDASFEGIGALIEGAGKYFLQMFADRDTVVYSGFSAPGKDDVLRYADIMRKYVKEVGIRGIDL
jgi:pyruvate formate lyase activating enzyme